MLNLIGKEPAHERRIEPEEDSMGRRGLGLAVLRFLSSAA
jgi:hypothetical protein